MKEVKKGVMDILLYGIVFVVVQLIVSFLGMLVWSFVQHEELADVRTAMLSGHNPVLLAPYLGVQQCDYPGRFSEDQVDSHLSQLSVVQTLAHSSLGSFVCFGCHDST